MTGLGEGDVRRRRIDADDVTGRRNRRDGGGQRTGPRPDVKHGIAVAYRGEFHEEWGECATPPAHEALVGIAC